MMGYLTSKFASMPTYLGTNNLDIVTEGGKQFVRMGSELKEVGQPIRNQYQLSQPIRDQY